MSANTCADSNVLISTMDDAAVWTRLEIRVGNVATTGNNSNATFYINGTSYSVSGVNMELSGGEAPSFSFYSTNSTLKYVGVDYIQVRGTSSAAR